MLNILLLLFIIMFVLYYNKKEHYKSSDMQYKAYPCYGFFCHFPY